ncbi:MAG: family 16 glycoside hydrolase, partial [Bacteroidota bacterium]
MPNILQLLLLTSLFFSPLQAQSPWTSLFDGQNLDAWTIINGTAEYIIEGEAIVGTSTMGTPNTFLRTKDTYSDFILEVEVYDDPRLNSGIQIRSNTDPAYRDGVVHGYQVEIDPSPRAYSGGIYDEQRRGWLYPLSYNPGGRKAFVNGRWNKYRIEARGANIRVWINGVQTADLVDNMTAEGFIGLQVHSINDPSVEGAQVKWRNIRIATTALDELSWSSDPDIHQVNLIANTISETEQRKGWRLLWDGQTTEGWRSARAETFP